jgi:CheY-like chemotaxis protein
MPCVLVVEDEHDIRRMMVLLLKAYGYETVTAGTGGEALDEMRRRRPCVVLLDVDLPIMNGWQFRETQLEDPAIRDVPIVCITDLYDHEEVTRRLGVSCLPKPANFADVIREVERACGASSPNASS